MQTLVHGQCTLSTNLVLEDFTTTASEIIIDNAANNDLSRPDQCVAEVAIRFRHQFLSDLNVFLVSPAGQRVRLIGQAILEGAYREFITWDVRFVACDSTAMPDLGFPARWDNQALWEFPNTYTGSYLPNQGCLEAFNTGSVNGVWRLEFTDISEFGDGLLESFSIKFCDGSMITCESCEIVLPTINTSPQDICESPDADMVILNTTYPSGTIIDTVNYRYGFAIFNQNRVTAYTRIVNFDNAIPGTYLVCPLTYKRNNESDLPAVGSAFTPQTLANTLNNNICGVLDTGCKVVRVLQQPDTTFTYLEACVGDTVHYKGRSYTTSSTDFFIKPGLVCDTVEQVAIDIIQPRHAILPSQPLITCTTPEIYLYADTNSTTATAIYDWKPLMGANILSENGDSALVNSRGRYRLVINDRGFIDSTETVVIADDSSPDLTVDIDSLTCLVDRVDFVARYMDTKVSYSWEGPSLLSSNDLINISTPGTYTVTVTARNGCTSVASVELVVDTSIVRPDIGVTNISCVDSLKSINLIGNPTSGYQYNWTGPNGYTENTLGADSVSVGGAYSLRIIARNGCEDTIMAMVNDNREFPRPEFNLPIVDCNATDFTASLTAQVPLDEVTWQSLNTFETFTGESTMLSTPGPYLVTLISDLECSFDTVIVVPTDTILPAVRGVGGELTCLVDSVQLDILGSLAGVNFSWSGPQLSSNLRDPYARIPGQYILQASGDNGCVLYDTVMVSNSLDRPNVQLTISQITCKSDTAKVFVSDPALDYQWEDNLLGNNAKAFESVTPGTYFLTVTNPLNGCDELLVYSIADQRDVFTLSSFVDTLNCDNDTVQIQLTTDASISTFSWQGPVLQPDSLQPIVDTEGAYIINIVDTFGCSLIDTIEVVRSISPPTITFPTFDFECSQVDTILTFLSDSRLDSVLWTGPNAFESTDRMPVISIPGDYTINVFASNGCDASATLTVGYDTLSPDLSILPFDTIKCDQLTVALSATSNTPNVSYAWRSSNNTLISNQDTASINAAGTYTITVRGDNRCITSDTFQVYSEAIFPQVTVQARPVTCANPNGLLRVTSNLPGSTYEWRLGNTLIGTEDSVFVNHSQMISLSVISPDGCVSQSMRQITYDTLKPVTTLVSNGPLSCNRPVVSVFGNALNTYEWTLPSGNMVLRDTLMVTNTGRYPVLITGVNGCTDTSGVFVAVDTSKLTVALSSDTLACNRGKVIIRVVSPDPIVEASWSGPRNFISRSIEPTVFLSGYYTVIARGQNGCESIDSIFVPLNNNKPLMAIDEGLFLPCDSTGVALSYQGIENVVSCQWFGPDNYFSGEDNPVVFNRGMYRLVCAAANGCTSSDTIMLEFDQDLPEFSFITDTITCDQTNGTLRALDIDDDLRVKWRFDNFTLGQTDQVFVTNPGTYELIVTGANQCNDTAFVEVLDDRIFPKVDLVALDSFICAQRTVRLRGVIIDSLGRTGFENQWNQQGLVIRNGPVVQSTAQQPGTYILTSRNVTNGCISKDTIVLNQLPNPNINYDIEVNDPTCEDFTNGNINISSIVGGSKPYQLFLSDTLESTNGFFGFLDGGAYELKVVDRFGCVDSTLVQLSVGRDPLFMVPPDTVIMLGDSLPITIQARYPDLSLDTIIWASTGQIPCINCLDTIISPYASTFYTVTLIDVNGCTSTGSFIVEVDRNTTFDIANVFSGLGQPGNQVFFIPDIPGVSMVEFLNCLNAGVN